MSSQRLWQHKRDPWMPPDYDDQVIYAVRAFAKGEAGAHQQKLVWEWLAYVGGVGDEWQDLAFRPGPTGDRDTTFVSGKQFPILQLRKLTRPELNPKKSADALRPGTENPAKPAHVTSPKRKRRR